MSLDLLKERFGGSVSTDKKEVDKEKLNEVFNSNPMVNLESFKSNIKVDDMETIGNKYYESKGKRWVIYAEEIDASKIPVEWYSWIHFTHNKIENNHELKKYDWQKPHQENLTGTDSAYYPNKNKNAIQKKYRSWKD